MPPPPVSKTLISPPPDTWIGLSRDEVKKFSEAVKEKGFIKPAKLRLELETGVGGEQGGKCPLAFELGELSLAMPKGVAGGDSVKIPFAVGREDLTMLGIPGDSENVGLPFDRMEGDALVSQN